MTTTIRLPKPRGFSLAAARDFYAGFAPGAAMAPAAIDAGLTLAFRLDGSFDAVAVALRDDGDHLAADVAGTRDAATLARQVGRILGLEGDGEAWRAIGERDPVVGRLQADFAGFFTAAKASPYDAATWGVLSTRMRIPQAAALAKRIAGAHGDVVRLGGRAHAVFPSPAQLLDLRRVEGLSPEKLDRLRGVARAALEGRLDADRLRAMAADDALRDLQRLRGVGPWNASTILYRGAAPPDGLPTTEPRVLAGLADAYGLESPTTATLERLAERWRPFRMWVCVLLARHLGRTGGWRRPGLARARADAGRSLERRLATASRGTSRDCASNP